MGDLMVRMADLFREAMQQIEASRMCQRSCDCGDYADCDFRRDADAVLAEYDALKAQPSQPLVAVPVVWQYRDRPGLSWRECSEDSHNIMRDEKDCDVEVRALCVASPSTADVAGARPALSGETGITNGGVAGWHWVNGTYLLVGSGGTQLCEAIICDEVSLDDAIEALQTSKITHRTRTAYALSAAPDPVSHTTGQEKG